MCKLLIISSWADRETILQLPLSRRRVDDGVFWRHDRKGDCTVKSVYRQLTLIQPSQQQVSMTRAWRQIWSSQVPLKCKNFTWRACSRALPTISALQHWNIPVTGDCYFCNLEPKTDFHVLFLCPFAQEIWLASKFNFQQHRFDNLASCCLSLADQLRCKKLQNFIMIMWAI